jgi:hypothetical protein
MKRLNLLCSVAWALSSRLGPFFVTPLICADTQRQLNSWSGSRSAYLLGAGELSTRTPTITEDPISSVSFPYLHHHNASPIFASELVFAHGGSHVSSMAQPWRDCLSGQAAHDVSFISPGVIREFACMAAFML